MANFGAMPEHSATRTKDIQGPHVSCCQTLGRGSGFKNASRIGLLNLALCYDPRP
jgi:hypothetical protein